MGMSRFFLLPWLPVLFPIPLVVSFFPLEGLHTIPKDFPIPYLLILGELDFEFLFSFLHNRVLEMDCQVVIVLGGEFSDPIP